MEFIIRLLISAVSVFIAAYLLPGVGVESFLTAVIVAALLGLLNAVVKPILVILTIPITLVTFGLFLLVTNAIIILFADSLVSGFSVDGFWWALLFSFILTIVNSLLKPSGKSSAPRRKKFDDYEEVK